MHTASDACCNAVVASEKGIVVGRLTFREDGDLIDCSKVSESRGVSSAMRADTCGIADGHRWQSYSPKY
jgi:hypothetical protein